MKKWFLIVGVVLVGILLVIGAGVLVWNLAPKDYDKITILNGDELSKKVGGGKVNDFRQELLSLLRETGVIGDDATVDDVTIREGTIVSQTEANESGGYWKSTTFLIDIDSLQQTYAVRLVDSDEDLPGVTSQIYCPQKSESKYPSAKCEGVYSSSDNSVGHNLPHELELSTGEKLLVKKVDVAKKNGEWTQTVQAYLYSCDEANPPVTEAERAVRSWVATLGDPIESYYKYNIRTGYCEGDAI